MALYAYKAVGQTAKRLSGTIVADSAKDARDVLRSRGLKVRQMTPCAPPSRAARAGGRTWNRPRHVAKVTALTRELATLLGVGVPLLEALDTIGLQHRGPFKAVVQTLRDRISTGLGIAEAMAEQPAVFDELAVNMVAVGESSGTLDVVLKELAGFRENALMFRSRVGTALLYPAIVLTMAVGVSVFLMTAVVPDLLDALVADGRPLPTATLIVKAASDTLVTKWWLVFGIGVGTVVAVVAAGRTARGRLLWHRAQLRTPVLGDLVRKQAVVRIATVLSTLLKSGVEFVKAIEIAERTTANVVLRDALRRCGSAVQSGVDIGDALDGTNAFPPVVVRVFAVGQQSGRLEEMLDRLASDYDAQVATAAQRLTAVLEPILILLLVFLVGFIAFATVMPMLEAADVF